MTALVWLVIGVLIGIGLSRNAYGLVASVEAAKAKAMAR